MKEKEFIEIWNQGYKEGDSDFQKGIKKEKICENHPTGTDLNTRITCKGCAFASGYGHGNHERLENIGNWNFPNDLMKRLKKGEEVTVWERNK